MTVKWVWSGATTEAGAQVKARLTAPAAAARLVVSASSPRSTTYVGPIASDADLYLSFDVTGLAPETKWQYGIELNGVLDPMRGTFRTLPPDGTAADFTIGFSSCSVTSSNRDYLVYERIIDKDPLFFVHTGDFHYDIPRDVDESAWVADDWRNFLDRAFTRQPRRLAQHRAMAVSSTWDDHDYNPIQVGSALFTKKDVVAAVYRQTRPHYPTRPTDPGDNAIYQSWRVGRVWFIMPDLRYHRDQFTDVADSTGTMLGDKQKRWVKERLLAAKAADAPLIFFISSSVWTSRQHADTWGAAGSERAELSAFSVANDIPPVVVLSGDLHGLAWAEGMPLGAGTRPWPEHVSGSLASPPGLGRPSAHWTFGPVMAMGQYSTLEVADDGTNVSYTVRGYQTNLATGSETLQYETVNNVLTYGPMSGRTASAYRPHEMLTAQVAEAMVRAINRIAVGPVAGQPLAFTLQTGGNSGNRQHNEIRWNVDILDGGKQVRPDSGDLTRYEGVADANPRYYDAYYWHPEPPPVGKNHDIPKSVFGFPTIPGLLDAARRPFTARGLGMPWFTAMGNHNEPMQGNCPDSTVRWSMLATGNLKVISPPPGIDPHDLPGLLEQGLVPSPYVRQVTADPGRRLLTHKEVVDEHFATSGSPVGHGFTERNRRDGTAYYSFDRRGVRFIVLDTVNPSGYSNGSLGASQFAWLAEELAAATDHLLIVASHHTSSTMTNPTVAACEGSEDRVLGNEVVTLLLNFPRVIAWVNGHTHTNQVWARRKAGSVGGFWEINTAAHIDWPQQSRLIEVVDNRDGTLSIFTTMMNHSGPASYRGRLGGPKRLASLARELAANDWHGRSQASSGNVSARNLELLVADPR